MKSLVVFLDQHGGEFMARGADGCRLQPLLQTFGREDHLVQQIVGFGWLGDSDGSNRSLHQ